MKAVANVKMVSSGGKNQPYIKSSPSLSVRILLPPAKIFQGPPLSGTAMGLIEDPFSSISQSLVRPPVAKINFSLFSEPPWNSLVKEDPESAERSDPMMLVCMAVAFSLALSGSSFMALGIGLQTPGRGEGVALRLQFGNCCPLSFQ